MPREKDKTEAGGSKERAVREAKNQEAAVSNMSNVAPDPVIYSVSQRLVLEKLPNEVLLNIMGQFEVDISDLDNLQQSIELRIALSKLALCSKRFNELVTPSLYSTLIQTNTKALPKFMKQMLDKPERQQYVRKIIVKAYARCDACMNTTCLTNYDFESGDSSVNDVEVDKSKMETIMATRNFCFDDRVLGWGDAIMEGNWDALFAVLCCLMTNLQELSIFRAGHIFTDDTRQVLAQVFDYSKSPENYRSSWDGENYIMPPASLTRLKTLNIYSFEMALQLEALSPLLQHSSLENLYIDSMEFGDDIRLPMMRQALLTPLAKDASAIKNLKIAFLPIEDHFIIDFLACFKTVERLEFGNILITTPAFDSTIVKTAINHLRPVLKELVMPKPIFNPAPYTTTSEPFFEKRIGSVREFTVLQFLSLDNCLIYGDDGIHDDFSEFGNPLLAMLPKSLRSLKIKNAQASAIQHIIDLVARKEENVPDLEEMEIHLLGHNGAELRILDEVCRKAGVLCTIT